MKIFENIATWREYRGLRADEVLGFVPTMGALHEGHLSLVRQSREQNQKTIVSLFLNPTQFNDPKDLARYPRPLDQDLQILEAKGADYVLLPQNKEVYADQYHYRVSETELSDRLCGAFRPGHFTGVLTVVLKLLLLTRARHAYFGEKDFQQLQLVKGMAEAFFLETEIIGVPTVREQDGLAMSSRNLLLSPEARSKAPLFAKILKESTTAGQAREALLKNGFKVEYVEDFMGRRCAAVFLDGVRLIDNV